MTQYGFNKRVTIDHPDAYIESNIIGFYNILEACRHSYDGGEAGVLDKDYDFEGHRELVGMQPGDVPVTYADSKGLEEDYGFTPEIGIRERLRSFCEWYREFKIC